MISADGALRLGRLELRPGFIVITALGCLFAPGLLFIQFLAAAALHEAAHAAVSALCGGRVERVTLGALGMEMRCESWRLSYRAELAVLAAGPLMNAAAGAACAFAARALACEPLYVFSGVNILLAAFNLLPARGLDGGGMLRVLSLMVFDREVAALRVIHILTAVSLAALGLWAAAHGGFNAAMLWIALWLLGGSRGE